MVSIQLFSIVHYSEQGKWNSAYSIYVFSIKMALVFAKTTASVLGLNYAVHYGSSMLYNAVCVPKNIWDIPYSIVSISSPVCTFFVNVMQLTQNNFAILATTTITSYLATSLRGGG